MICCCLLQLPVSCLSYSLFVLGARFCYRYVVVVVSPFSSHGPMLFLCSVYYIRFPKGFFLHFLSDKEKTCLHAECIPIDRLRCYRIVCIRFCHIFCFFIEWTNNLLCASVCLTLFIFRVCHRDRRRCRGVWVHVVLLVISSILLDFGIRIAFCQYILKHLNACRFSIPLLHRGSTNRLPITQKEILIIARILIHQFIVSYGRKNNFSLLPMVFVSLLVVFSIISFIRFLLYSFFRSLVLSSSLVLSLSRKYSTKTPTV